MKTLLQILAVISFVASIGAGLYVGFYVCIYGGIVTIIEAVQMVPIPAGAIAWGIIKILLSSIAGYSAFVLGLLVSGLFQEAAK